MWELDHKEGWMPKDWCFWTVVLEETLESPLDWKEINPEYSLEGLMLKLYLHITFLLSLFSSYKGARHIALRTHLNWGLMMRLRWPHLIISLWTLFPNNCTFWGSRRTWIVLGGGSVHLSSETPGRSLPRDFTLHYATWKPHYYLKRL